MHELLQAFLADAGYHRARAPRLHHTVLQTQLYTVQHLSAPNCRNI